MALVRATHPVYGEHLIPASRLALHPDEWTPVEPTATAPRSRPKRTPKTSSPSGDAEPSGDGGTTNDPKES